MWNGSPVSSNLRVEDCRFIPSLAAQAAVALVAAPHQMRSRNPSEYGSRRSSPGGLGNIGRGFGLAKPLPRSRSRNSSAWRRPMPASSSPSTGLVAKIAPSIDHLLGRTAADSQLQAPASDEIRSASVLRHVVRVLIAHVDDGGADFNLSRLGADRREQRKWRCQLPREMMNTEVGSVHSQALGLDGEVNGLQERVSRRLRS